MKRPTLNTRWLAKPVAMATLLVSLLGGVPGALAATSRNLEFLVERLSEFPAGCTWGVAGIGRHQLSMADLAIQWGGNARVGLEDNFYLPDGTMARSNGELVAKARALTEDVGRRPATVAEARALLGVSRTVAA